MLLRPGSPTIRPPDADGRRLRGAAAAILAALLLPGCAALPVAALGGLLQAGGGALVKTGTEYTASGAALRTFTIPIEDVHGATLEAFRRNDLALTRDELTGKGRLVVGKAEHRTVKVHLVPLTRTLTAMELVVKRNLLASDKATASELLAQTEQVLAERPEYARRLELERAPDGLPRR